MRRDPPSRRGSRPNVAAGTNGGLGPLVTGSLTASAGKSTSSSAIHNNLIAAPVANTLGAHHGRGNAEDAIAVTPLQDATRGRRGIQNGIGVAAPGDPSFTLATRSTHAIAFHASQDPISSTVFSPSLGRKDTMGVITFAGRITHPENRERCLPGAPAPTVAATTVIKAISYEMRPRRLTPREWERLQGFPDDYTAITIGRAIAKDTPRYQAIGNSMAVPVIRWIGERIALVDPLVDFG